MIIHSSNFPGRLSNIPLFYLTLLWSLCFLFHHLLTLSLNHGVPQGSAFELLFYIYSFWWFYQVSWLPLPPPVCWWLPNFHKRTHAQECVESRGLNVVSFFPTSILIYPSIYSTFPFWYLRGTFRGSQVAPVVTTLPASVGDTGDPGAVPGSGRSPAGGQRNPLQYVWLEHPTDRGAWQTTVDRVTKSQTWLKQLSMQADILNFRSKTKLLIFTATSSNIPFLPYQLMIAPSFQTIWRKSLESYFHSALFLCFHIQFTKVLLAPPHLCNILLSVVLSSVPVPLKFILKTIIIVILGQYKSNHSLLGPVSAALHFIN